MKTYLKIKIKSLAAEARIIRQEEKKWPGPSDVRLGLWAHRTGVVRDEARASLLAYGYLRNRRYRQIEPHGEVPCCHLGPRRGVDGQIWQGKGPQAH